MVNHPNRGRLTVDTDGNWRLYTHILPPGSRAIGVITSGSTEAGALVLIEATAQYVQINAGVMRNLPQHKVRGALRDKQT